jgi:enoyl-CoA hydratase/carnithine racemase/AcrR family transcriptional regulator
MASTRDSALHAAAEVLAAEGLAALTLERVAGAVGVKPASLYHHFASRDQLIGEVLAIGSDAVRVELMTTLAAIPGDQPLRRLEAAARAHLRAIRAHRPFTTAYLRNVDQLPPGLRKRMAPHQRAVDECWRRVFDAAARAGIFPPHVDVRALRGLVLGALESAGRAPATRGEPAGDVLGALLVELLRGTAIGPSRAPTSLVEVDVGAPVGRIRLSNPPVNALTEDVVAGLDAAVETLTRSPARVVVVESAVAGEYCAGADLALLRRLDTAGFETYLRDLRAAFERLANAPFPTIAIVDGPAMGCGLELAIACTFRVATPRATFAIPEITMGLSPGAGSTQRLPRLVGRQVALDLVLSGRTVEATEAHVTGLVDRLDEDAAPVATAWALQMARAPRDVLSAALRSVRAHGGAGEGPLAELREAVSLFGSPAATEGIEAHAASVAAGPARRAPRRR